MPNKKTFNICIVAHIDHGKSTLSDRILQICGAVEAHKFQNQFLDSMSLERERGVTIKAHPVRLSYKEHIIHLIDTPGHEDFHSETSISIILSDIVALLVDATQGVQPQTIFNLGLAKRFSKPILPVINKIDACSDFVEEIKKFFLDNGIKEDVIMLSAKTGFGVKEFLEKVVSCKPTQEKEGPFEGMVMDGFIDNYLGVVVNLKVNQGVLNEGEKIFIDGKGPFLVKKVGFLTPNRVYTSCLKTGQIGFMLFNVLELNMIKMGALLSANNKAIGGVNISLDQKVFCNLFPHGETNFEKLKVAVESLAINDHGVKQNAMNSGVLGRGLRCGFLGVFHMEIFKERLRREQSVDFVSTEPSLDYRKRIKEGHYEYFSDPAQVKIDETIEVPYCKTVVSFPWQYIGKVKKCLMEVENIKIVSEPQQLAGDKFQAVYLVPYRDALSTLTDRLKSASNGYCSIFLEEIVYQKGKYVKATFKANDQEIEGISFIDTKERAYRICKEICSQLKGAIARRQYAVVINGCIDNKKVVREEIKPYRKDVTAKCYGGDVTRKRKLLEKQAKGKKRMFKSEKISVDSMEIIKALGKEKPKKN